MQKFPAYKALSSSIVADTPVISSSELAVFCVIQKIQKEVLNYEMFSMIFWIYVKRSFMFPCNQFEFIAAMNHSGLCKIAFIGGRFMYFRINDNRLVIKETIRFNKNIETIRHRTLISNTRCLAVFKLSKTLKHQNHIRSTPIIFCHRSF